MDNLHQQFADIAKEYATEKVPYRHRGMSRSGCDCCGLPLAILRELGYLKSYKLPLYPHDWNEHAGSISKIIPEVEKFADLVKSYTAGDLLIFRFLDRPSHVGIFVGNDTFVHCLRAAGKCLSTLLSTPAWNGRIHSIYHFSLNKLEACG